MTEDRQCCGHKHCSFLDSCCCSPARVRQVLEENKGPRESKALPVNRDSRESKARKESLALMANKDQRVSLVREGPPGRAQQPERSCICMRMSGERTA